MLTRPVSTAARRCSEPRPAAGNDLRVAGLDARHPRRGEPPRQPAGRGRGHRRNRRQRLRGGVDPVAVHRGDELAVQQLALRQGRHQLPAGETAGAGLDRTDPRVQGLDDPEAVHQLTHRQHPRRPGQRRVRRPEPHRAARRLSDAATSA